MKRRHLFGAAAAVAATAALLGGVLAGTTGAGSAPQATPQAAVASQLDGFAAGDTAAEIDQLERRVRANPEDAEGLTLLGLAYEQRVRETGDPGFYRRSEEALRRAIRLVPDDDLAFTGLATLAASRHRFAEARDLARKALSLNSYSAAALGISTATVSRGWALAQVRLYQDLHRELEV